MDMTPANDIRKKIDPATGLDSIVFAPPTPVIAITMGRNIHFQSIMFTPIIENTELYQKINKSAMRLNPGNMTSDIRGLELNPK